MPTGARSTAAASVIHNVALGPAVPPPPVLGAPLGVTVVVEGAAVGHWFTLGEDDAVGQWLPVDEGESIADGLGSGDGESIADAVGSGEGDASSAAATPLVPPNTIAASDAAANRRSHNPPRRRTGSLVPCGDPSSIIFCTTTPLRSQSRFPDLELLGFRRLPPRVVRTRPAV